MSIQSQMTHWWFSILLLATILLLNLLPSQFEDLLNLRHLPIDNGQWWRIYSSQIIHLSFNHTLLNFAGYAFVAFSFRDEIPPLREITILVISATGVGFGIYLLNPQMYSYVGLSGAIYGVLVAYVIIGINRTPGLSFLFLAFIIGKFIFEYFNGGSARETEEFIGGRVAVESHVYGALSGILPGIFYYLQDRKRIAFEDTQRFIDHFKDPVVRDLAWALHSSPLVSLRNDRFQSIRKDDCLDIAKDFFPTLQALDADPEKLHNSVHAEDSRLGVYFEKLITFWLKNQNRFDLVKHNLKVEEEKITVGEFDFIIKDNKTHETIHWEVAIKFYLGIGDCDKQEHFYGPGKKDRLDIKTNRLANKQIRLSEHPAAKNMLDQLGIKIDKRVLFVKGRLFYPAQTKLHATPIIDSLASSHLKSHWYTVTELLTLNTSNFQQAYWQKPCFHIADRDEWLTYKSNANLLSLTSLKEKIKESPLERPTVIVVTLNHQEVSRFFLVPDCWTDTLTK